MGTFQAVYPMPGVDGTQRIEAAVIFKADAGVGPSDLSQHVTQSAALVRRSRQDRLVGSFVQLCAAQLRFSTTPC